MKEVYPCIFVQFIKNWRRQAQSPLFRVVNLPLMPFGKAFTIEIIDCFNPFDFGDCFLEVIFNTPVAKLIFIQGDITGTVVVVAGLSNRPDIDNQLGRGGKWKESVNFIGSVECPIISNDTWEMGMTAKTEVADEF